MDDGKHGVAKKEKPKKKWRDGVAYKCIHSASPGYRVGETYTAHKNDDGHICLTGRDGYVDICGMLVSEFKEVTENATQHSSDGDSAAQWTDHGDAVHRPRQRD